ncbi:hypothetical protein ABBQ38_008785 [Trebouxia sp. C0009 RCD-2024]
MWVANHQDPANDVLKEGDFTPSGGRGKGYVQFIPMLTALDPKAGYLGEGHLTIGVHICLSVTNMVDVPGAQLRHTLGSALCNNLRALFDDPITSDVAITAGETTIHAHKLVLAAQSLSFNAMFQSGMRETDADEVELGDLEGPVLVALISAMYGKLTNIAPAIALPLFRAADAYQVEPLRQACLKQVIDGITIDTVFACYSAADAVADKELRAACTRFTACPPNSVLVAKHPDMLDMMRDNPEMAQKIWIDSASLHAAEQQG